VLIILDVLDYPGHASAHGLGWGISLEAVSRLSAKAAGCMDPPPDSVVTTPGEFVIDIHCTVYIRLDVLDYPDHASAQTGVGRLAGGR
jgi:hypothetical protein